jgi:hypothetical protein
MTMDGDYGNNEDPLSLHKYLYVENDPVNMADPTGHDAVNYNAIYSLTQGTLRRLSDAEQGNGAKCVPWVSTWVKDPELDQSIQKAIKLFDHVETFERLMSVAVIVTINQELGIEAALDEAATDIATEGEKVPLSVIGNIVDLEDQFDGNWGGWYGYTGVPRKEVVPGIIFDSTVIKWQWRRVGTGGFDDKGRYDDKDQAWKGACQACQDRIDSNDL